MHKTLQSDGRSLNQDAENQVDNLVKKAAEGNRYAFDQLVGLLHEEIFRMVYYRVRSRMDAEDLTQEIFIKAYRNLKSLKDPGRFRAWLFRIGINHVRDFFRKKKVMAVFSYFSGRGDVEQHNPDQTDTGRSENTSALDSVMKKEFWEQVNLLLDRLSPMEREVFVLRFMDNLSIIEITRVLDKSESTVKTHLYRALNKFRGENELRRLLKEEIS